MGLGSKRSLWIFPFNPFLLPLQIFHWHLMQLSCNNMLSSLGTSGLQHWYSSCSILHTETVQEKAETLLRTCWGQQVCLHSISVLKNLEKSMLRDWLTKSIILRKPLTIGQLKSIHRRKFTFVWSLWKPESCDSDTEGCWLWLMVKCRSFFPIQRNRVCIC